MCKFLQVVYSRSLPSIPLHVSHAVIGYLQRVTPKGGELTALTAISGSSISEVLQTSRIRGARRFRLHVLFTRQGHPSISSSQAPLKYETLGSGTVQTLQSNRSSVDVEVHSYVQCSWEVRLTLILTIESDVWQHAVTRICACSTYYHQRAASSEQRPARLSHTVQPRCHAHMSLLHARCGVELSPLQQKMDMFNATCSMQRHSRTPARSM